MGNKLYKIIGGVAYDIMLKAKNRIVSGVATAFPEGAMKVIGGVAYPVTRFDTLPFYMSQSGLNMTGTYLANNTTLLASPFVIGMGSSTMFGHGLGSPNRYWDKVSIGVSSFATSPTFYNIAVEGITSASMQTTAQGGTPGQNLDTAFSLGANIIVWDEPTNGLGSYSPAQQIIYWEQAYIACLKRGILIFFNSARPRTPYTTLQQQALKDFNTLLAAHPYLKYVSNIDGDSFWNTSTTYSLSSTYDQGDGIHLNSAGTTLLANDTLAMLQKVFRLTTAYSAIEVHRSTDGTNYSLYDTITDFANYKKTYSHLSGYYKTRGKLKDGTYMAFGTAIQITNASPTANAGGSQSITLPTSSITLSGSGSDTDGTIVSYLWTKVSGPAFGTITSPTSASTTATGMTEAGTYVYRLTVTDNEGATGFNDATITVSAAGNVSPTANAGSDQTLAAGATTGTLSGSGSDSDGTIAGYAWSQISGPNTAGITSPTAASSGLTGLIAGDYVFRLTVTDNLGATGIDDVQITAVAAVLYKFNFNATAQSIPGYIDVSGNPWAGSIDSAVYPGTTIFIRCKQLNASSVNIWGQTANTSSNNSIGAVPSPVDSGAFPNAVLVSGMFTTGQTYAAGNEPIEIRGLTPGSAYTINAIGSRIASAVATANRYMEWHCVDANGTTAITNYDVKGNQSVLATFTSQIADGSGVIKLAINRPFPTDANYNFGYIMGCTIQEG